MRDARPVAGIAVLLAILLQIPAGAQAQTVFAEITGPSAMAPGRVATYNVTISGGPSGSVDYSLEYYLTGSDLTGGSPTSSAPGKTSGNRTFFTVNVTAPQRDQTVTLVVKVAARSGGRTENGSAELPIAVVTPVVLSAVLRNASPTAAVNTTVRFYVDGVLVGTTVVPLIAGNGQGTASFSWLPTDLAPGNHAVRVEADIDRNGVIDPARGEVVTSDFFIREGESLSSGWTFALAIGVFIPAFFIAVALRRRRRA